MTQTKTGSYELTNLTKYLNVGVSGTLLPAEDTADNGNGNAVAALSSL